MSNGSEEDLRGWEYDMVWTLFNIGDEEGGGEGSEEKKADGLTVRILKFLFGGSADASSDPEDCENYHEKRPYHRHIQQPATRRSKAHQPFGQDTDKSKTSTPGAPDSEYVIRRLEAESALMRRPSMGMPGPEVFPPGERDWTCYIGFLRVISALLTGVLIMFLSSIWSNLMGIKDFLKK